MREIERDRKRYREAGRDGYQDRRRNRDKMREKDININCTQKCGEFDV